MVPAQYYHPTLPPSHEFPMASAYDTSLFDPVGIYYSQDGGRSGEQHANYTGSMAYGGPVQQQNGPIGPFGK